MHIEIHASEDYARVSKEFVGLLEKLKVFISSTMEDLKEERKALAEAINKNRFWKPVYAESFVARKESPREVCLEEVRRSHIYIGIFKNKYGYVPQNDNPQGYSAVALEYYEAIKNQLPIFIFIYKDNSKRESKLIEFLNEITDFDKGHWRIEYYAIDQLVKFVLDAINREVTMEYIKSINAKRRAKIIEIYNLPYFERFKESLKNE